MPKTKKTTKPASKKIEKNTSTTCCTTSKCGSICKEGCGYFLGFIGAAIYYISTSTGFWNGVLGVLKAAIWPLFLVLEALKFLGA